MVDIGLEEKLPWRTRYLKKDLKVEIFRLRDRGLSPFAFPSASQLLIMAAERAAGSPTP